MSIQIEDLGALKRKVSIAFPAAEIAETKAARLKQIAKNFRRPGFRAGKVPMALIVKELGAGLDSEAAADRAGRLFFDICKDKQIKVAGRPALEEQKAADGHFSFDMIFEVYPETPLLTAEHFADFAFNDYQCEVGDADLEEGIVVLQKMLGAKNAADAEHTIAESDLVTIAISKIISEGEEKTNVLPLNEKVTVDTADKNNPVYPLIAQLIGKKIGTHEVECTFDNEDFKAFENKSMTMTVVISAVQTLALAEMDEAFFQKAGTKDLETLRTDLRSNLSKQIQANIKTLSMSQIVNKLRSSDLAIPQNMVEEEAQAIKDKALADQEKNNQAMLRVILAKPLAEERLRVSFYFSKFAEEHKLQVKPEQIRERINLITSAYDDSEQIKRMIMQNEEMISGIQTQILEEQIAEAILAFLPNKDVKKVSVRELSKLIETNKRDEDARALELFRKQYEQNSESVEDAAETANPTFALAEEAKS